jgi:alanine-synthesizing transaminase
VAVAPGIGFGEYGDDHVRIAFVENTQRLRQAVRSIRGFLQGESNVGAPVQLAAAAH